MRFFSGVWMYATTPVGKGSSDGRLQSLGMELDVRTGKPVAAEVNAYRMLNSSEWIPAKVYESVFQRSHRAPVR
jgi:hypothetical protein